MIETLNISDDSSEVERALERKVNELVAVINRQDEAIRRLARWCSGYAPSNGQEAIDAILNEDSDE
jgi:hypothetical protein